MKPNHLILYILVLACAFFGFDPKWGYVADSPWWTHLTFHFAHGNIFHLAANMLVVFLLLLNRRDHWALWPLSYICATVVSFLFSTANPTVGLSGVLFVFYGVIFMKNGLKWRSLLTTLAYMAVSCLFASRLAIGLHAGCLLLGLLAGLLIRLFDNMKSVLSVYD